MAAERPDEDSTGAPQEAAADLADPFLTQPLPDGPWDAPWDEAWLPTWVGPELPAGAAPRPDPQATTQDPPATSGRVSVHDVADLLARSGSVHRIPLQRRVAHHPGLR